MEFVAEYTPTGTEPDGGDAGHQARYWTGVNALRWSQALGLEKREGLAICDSDPLKLHYSWCLARVGAAPLSRFTYELACVREAMSQQRIGFADIVLMTVPDQRTLRLQKESDSTRSRRSFELHAKLREPLIEWYESLDRLKPNHVVWQLPQNGVASILETVPLAGRYDLGLLDALVEDLPSLE